MTDEKPKITIELAFALGMRDRCQGGDAECRNETLWAHGIEGDAELTSAFWQGHIAAEDYIENYHCDRRRMKKAGVDLIEYACTLEQAVLDADKALKARDSVVACAHIARAATKARGLNREIDQIAEQLACEEAAQEAANISTLN